MQTMSCSSSEWPHNKHQIQSPYDQTSMIITNQPCLVSDSNESRPTKRKSRASRKIPTTILNADVANFRALVQKLTGRPSSGPSRVGLSHKGPLNINFGKGDDYEGDQLIDSVLTSTMLPFGYSKNNNHHQQHIQQLEKQQNQQGRLVEHEDMLSSSNVQSTASTARDDALSTNLDLFDDFDVDDLCNLEELAWLASSDGVIDDVI